MIGKITQYFLGNKNDNSQRLEIAMKLKELEQKEAALYLFSVLAKHFPNNPDYIIPKNQLLKELGKTDYIIPPEEEKSELQKLQGYKMPHMMQIALELEAHSYKEAALILFQQLVAANPQEKAFRCHVGRLSLIEDERLIYKH